jgi:predicted DNA-binding transcriptional regulator AlpA
MTFPKKPTAAPGTAGTQHQQVLPPDRGPYRPARQVCERYGVTDRTLDRWLADPTMQFPRPLVINRRRFFSEPELIAWERKRASRAA